MEDKIEKVKAVITDMFKGISIGKSTERHDISREIFFKVLLQYPDLQSNYECAQQAKAELFAEEVVDISDEEENPMKAKNRIDARKWYAAVMKPKKFAERIDLNITETIDIRGALEEARSRTLLPICYPKQIDKNKVLEIKAESISSSTGQQPVNADAQPQSGEDLLK